MTARYLARTLALLILGACASASPRPRDEVSYHRYGPLEASAMVERDVSDVLAAVDLMNATRGPVSVTYAGDCAIGVLIFRSEDGGTSPRWDSSRWWGERGECPSGTQRMEIPPETLARIVAPVVSVAGILGDSLPPGSYHAAIRLRLVEPRDTVLILPAGRVELNGEW